MKKERVYDVIAGVASLIFIGFVCAVYFTTAFTSGGLIRAFDSNELVTYDRQGARAECHVLTDKPTIVLRMDDVRAYSKPTPFLVDEALRRNLSMTLGVIPRDLEKDATMRDYLTFLRTDKRIEIAQHGYKHLPSDQNLSGGEILTARRIIVENLGVIPVTYIPPYNQMSPKAHLAMQNYFDIYSASGDTVKDGRTAEIGQTVRTYEYDEEEVSAMDNPEIPVAQIVSQCADSLARDNICVVVIHPQEFSSAIVGVADVSSEKLDRYRNILTGLQTLNVRFATMHELVDCK